MSEALDYLAAAVIDQMRLPLTPEISSLAALKEVLSAAYRVDINDIQAELAARRLEQLGFLYRFSDQYAGIYFVPPNSINFLLRISAVEKALPDSQFVKALHGGKRLFQRVFANPKYWQDLSDELEDNRSDETGQMPEPSHDYVPASDRVVTLSHNHQLELEETSTGLIDTLSKENSIDGDAGLKDIFLGQLRAGRELIRAQTFRAFLLYETLMTILGGLIERYKDQAIGQAAKKLLDLLIEHIFGK